MVVHVLGGGLIGLLCARELAQLGHRVVVVERGSVGRQASWAGGGILSPLYPWRYPDAVTRLAQWGQQHYPKIAEELRDTSGIDPEWIQSGMLTLAPADPDRARNWAEKYGIRLEEVSVRQLQQLMPGLDWAGSALWEAGVAQVRSPRLLAALRGALLRKGVQIRENVAVEGFSYRHGRLQALRTNQGEIAAEACVVATGAWTGALLESIGLTLPVRPVRGQMLLLRGRPGLVSQIIMKEGRYLVPRLDGRILVGSTLEEASFDCSTTELARRELWEAAIALVPALAGLEIEAQWAGLRPGSPEGVPYIGKHPEVDGLWVCAGHYRNGIVLGPASARLLADLMGGRPPLMDPQPYAQAGLRAS